MDRRGWRLARSPAEADLLLVLGRPGPRLTAATEVLWSQIPAPRHRATLVGADVLEARLDAAQRSLLDPSAWAVHADDPADRLRAQTEPEGHGQPGDDEGHGGHGAADVAGLPMAETGSDRDGLQLDWLTVRLGPVLLGWPTGLVFQGRLRGDVLEEPLAEWLDGAQPGPTTDMPSQVIALDALSRFLLVAGWPTAAGRSRAARDGLRSPSPATRTEARRRADAVSRRVAGSRALAWSLRGLVPLAGADSEPVDVLDQVWQWCAAARGQSGLPPAPPIETLAAAVSGSELGAVRLAVAAAGLDRPSARTRAGVA